MTLVSLGIGIAITADADSQKAMTFTVKGDKGDPASVNGKDSESLNELWTAISPCWNCVADRKRVEHHPGSQLLLHEQPSKPRVVDRDPSAQVDQHVLRSESQAITALMQCGPYLTAFGQKEVRVRFR